MEKLEASPGAVAAPPPDEPFLDLGARPASAGARAALDPTDTFVRRHIGPDEDEVREMLGVLGLDSLDALVRETVPATIRLHGRLALTSIPSDRQLGEREVLDALRRLAERNQVFRSYLGMGYHDCVIPGVIQRNVLESPGWYTQYTPYQAEISQGRLEALLNFQTLVADLTGLPVANASLLDEATAAAEAMHMCMGLTKDERNVFFVAGDCHPQTIEVVRTRADALGVEILVGRSQDLTEADLDDVFGVLVQYPATDGRIVDYSHVAEQAHQAGAFVVAATDLLALTLLRPPGGLRRGRRRRLGAAFRRASGLRRPARGVPRHPGRVQAADPRPDHRRLARPPRPHGPAHGDADARAAHPAREGDEQHLHRAGAARGHGRHVRRLPRPGRVAPDRPPGACPDRRPRRGVAPPELRRGERALLRHPARGAGARSADEVIAAARERRINLRKLGERTVGIALDEAATAADVDALLEVFEEGDRMVGATAEELAAAVDLDLPAPHARNPETSEILTHPVFNRYHTEHEMLRYIKRLEGRDLSLTTSMIPLGSCTMKLNATAEMVPITWPGFNAIHPFAPPEQTEGYRVLFRTLERWLSEITGFAACSLQPNAGSQGEYTGLMVIRAWQAGRGDEGREGRDVCLIPVSAHGTNPASAVMAGMRVVPVACDEGGNVELSDLRAKAAAHRDQLAALMVTYPSTHGVFEEGIREICDIVHEHGGLVYLDGANMNAQVGLCRPGDYGADVCHLNLHKTFCIPHGGGGPGMGPICVTAELAPFLPGHPVIEVGGREAIGPVSAAPWGSASILPISWAYIALMGAEGLTRASQVAILNANYMAARLSEHYPVLYKGAHGRVAHEFILDLRPFKATAGIEAEDVAKRLMDFGFHAPTMSFPVAGTLMIEPTESESKAELDRFCDAMIAIREEIRAIEEGRLDRQANPLKLSPHTVDDLADSGWDRPYSREQAVFPAPWVRDRKFWPFVGRVDNPWGDRNLMCLCPPVETYG